MGLHPDARRILDHPLFWDANDYFAPHGNDCGADLLSEYARWRGRSPTGDALEFRSRLIDRWRLFDDGSEQARAAVDQAAVALAFAELKHRGGCPPDVARLARKAVERQRREAMESANALYRQQRLESLALIEPKLDAYPLASPSIPRDACLVRFKTTGEEDDARWTRFRDSLMQAFAQNSNAWVGDCEIAEGIFTIPCYPIRGGGNVCGIVLTYLKHFKVVDGASIAWRTKKGVESVVWPEE